NKVKGIRAALCHDELTAEMSRRHNNANILCLPADLLGEELLRRVVDVWLKTDYEGGRHDRRLKKITDFENNGQCSP
ncbi:MAG: RpiB/LacA/LacB family sugar-phosphate isomerase, partial [Phycisphaerales bacterium]|nr:RpiB/LacA/LacB family sugar-phosphate isomerase [Phycisphaerales bacterium]